jgi:hypothetical protein
METKGVKILKNVTTCWIFMLFPIWHVMMEYNTLLMKIAIDGLTNDKTKEKFDSFHDVQILLKFIVIFPLLQSIHNLIKFS